jgi:hypothetical protein
VFHVDWDELDACPADDPGRAALRVDGLLDGRAVAAMGFATLLESGI